MKIFGYAANIDTNLSQATRENLEDLLDTMHESLTSDPNVYSADLVAEGLNKVTALVGVLVSDTASVEDAAVLLDLAFDNAFSAAGIDASHAPSTDVARVREVACA